MKNEAYEGGRKRGYSEGLAIAEIIAKGVEKDGLYFGDPNIDSYNSIYQQGACEVRELIKEFRESL